jgi:hypothetical protein
MIILDGVRKRNQKYKCWVKDLFECLFGYLERVFGDFVSLCVFLVVVAVGKRCEVGKNEFV